MHFRVAVAIGAVAYLLTTVHSQPLLGDNVSVITIAGSGGGFWADGVGSGASFNQPRGVAAFPGGAGLVVVDHYNNRIRVSGNGSEFAGAMRSHWVL